MKKKIRCNNARGYTTSIQPSEGAKFNYTSISNWKLLFEVKFIISKDSTKTIRLLTLDFYEVLLSWSVWCLEFII